MKAPVYNVYLPYFYSYDKGHYINVVKVSLPQNKYFQKILTSRHNFLITIVDEGIDLISPDIFKLPQKKYFLYNKSNIIQQTFITEINKPILVHGSIGFLVKKTENEKVQIVLFSNPLDFKVQQGTDKNALDFELRISNLSFEVATVAVLHH